jgi:hypothetical protein
MSFWKFRRKGEDNVAADIAVTVCEGVDCIKLAQD